MSRRAPRPYIGITAQRNTEDPKMTTTKLLNSLLIGALLASVSAHAAEQQPSANALDQGKQTASFNVGASRCVLKNDQIRSVPPNIKFLLYRLFPPSLQRIWPATSRRAFFAS